MGYRFSKTRYTRPTLRRFKGKIVFLWPRLGRNGQGIVSHAFRNDYAASLGRDVPWKGLDSAILGMYRGNGRKVEAPK